MGYSISARSGEFVIIVDGREIMRVTTREEADRLIAAYLEVDWQDIISFKKVRPH